MSDKDAGEGQAAPRSLKSRLVPLGIIVGLMVAEGVGVFFLAKSISPDPIQVRGDEVGGDDRIDGDGLAEIEMAECRPANRMAGKFVMFHIRVSALVRVEDYDRAHDLARAKRARLEDGVNAIIRSAEPQHFNEPRYETIKRKLKKEFDRIFGDEDLIKEVLIPQLLQSGPGV